MNTMDDLRQEVATRMRNAMHGREIDMFTERAEVPHMLGITPLGKTHDPRNEEQSLLDPSHHFWDEYHKDVQTMNKVNEEIQTAIRSLKKDDVFRMTYPYGEEAEIVYVEVDELGRETDVPCLQCDSMKTDVTRKVEQSGNTYSSTLRVSCNECSFSGSFENRFVRQ